MHHQRNGPHAAVSRRSFRPGRTVRSSPMIYKRSSAARRFQVIMTLQNRNEPSGWTALFAFIGLRLFAAPGQEAGVPVAGVAGVLSLRGDNVTDLFWDLAPGLGRITGTGRLAFPAVRQAGEDADGIGVGRTLGGIALAVDLSGLRRADPSAEQEQGSGGGAQYCSESHVFPPWLVNFSAT